MLHWFWLATLLLATTVAIRAQTSARFTGSPRSMTAEAQMPGGWWRDGMMRCATALMSQIGHVHGKKIYSEDVRSFYFALRETWGSHCPAAQLCNDGNVVVNHEGCASNGGCSDSSSPAETTQNLSHGRHGLVFKLRDADGNV
jgi:hypothetical protein